MVSTTIERRWKDFNENMSYNEIAFLHHIIREHINIIQKKQPHNDEKIVDQQQFDHNALEIAKWQERSDMLREKLLSIFR